MNRKTKHLLSSILFASTSLLYFFLAYIGCEDQNIDLKRTKKYTNVITNKGVGIHYGSKGRQSFVFFIELKYLEQKLGIYRKSKNYDDLLEKVNVGDTVKVFFKPSNTGHSDINIDLIQVEKGDVILIDKSEYEQKQRFLVYIGLITGILILYLAFRYYKYESIFSNRKRRIV